MTLRKKSIDSLPTWVRVGVGSAIAGVAIAGCSSASSQESIPSGSDTIATSTNDGSSLDSDGQIHTGEASSNSGSTNTPEAITELKFDNITGYNQEDGLEQYGAILRQRSESGFETDDEYRERLTQILAYTSADISSPENIAVKWTNNIAQIMNSFGSTAEKIDDMCKYFGDKMQIGTDDVTTCLLEDMHVASHKDTMSNAYLVLGMEELEPYSSYDIVPRSASDSELYEKLRSDVVAVNQFSNMRQTLDNNRLDFDPSLMKSVIYDIDPSSIRPYDTTDTSHPGAVFTVSVTENTTYQTASVEVTVQGFKQLETGTYLPAGSTSQ